jgi:hypothetical protein
MLVACCMSLVATVEAETLRDPFTFGPREGTSEASPMTLIGVLWNAPKPLAIVGDRMVGLGDQVGGWEIVQIQEDGIVIQRDDRRETVAIGNSLPTD